MNFVCKNIILTSLTLFVFLQPVAEANVDACLEKAKAVLVKNFGAPKLEWSKQAVDLCSGVGTATQVEECIETAAKVIPKAFGGKVASAYQEEIVRICSNGTESKNIQSCVAAAAPVMVKTFTGTAAVWSKEIANICSGNTAPQNVAPCVESTAASLRKHFKKAIQLSVAFAEETAKLCSNKATCQQIAESNTSCAFQLPAPKEPSNKKRNKSPGSR